LQPLRLSLERKKFRELKSKNEALRDEVDEWKVNKLF
jgi:hypothetical protein